MSRGLEGWTGISLWISKVGWGGSFQVKETTSAKIWRQEEEEMSKADYFRVARAQVRVRGEMILLSTVLLLSRSVMSNSLQPHGLQHARLPCPSPAPRVCLNSCPLSGWCHPTISSFATLFSFYLQFFPASESFLMSRLFASGGQSIGVSASTSVLPMNIQGCFPLGWIG